MMHTNYRIGQYKQVGKEKVFHTEYEFFITPDDDKALWGKMDIREVREFVDYVKSIPAGKDTTEHKIASANASREHTG